jgi:hypothetical protein
MSSVLRTSSSGKLIEQEKKCTQRKQHQPIKWGSMTTAAAASAETGGYLRTTIISPSAGPAKIVAPERTAGKNCVWFKFFFLVLAWVLLV